MIISLFTKINIFIAHRLLRQHTSVIIYKMILFYQLFITFERIVIGHDRDYTYNIIFAA